MLIITMLISYGYGQQRNQQLQKNQANRQKFWSPCRRGNMALCASPNGAHPWLHAKPLDAAIGQVPVAYCPGGRHGWWFWMKPKNTNKTQLLPSFLMVDRRKKAKQFWDPKQTLYSHHQCDKLRTNVKLHYLSWRAQLHFELSNIVNGQIEKLLTLNKAQESLWAIYGPIAVKLLRFDGKPFFPQNGGWAPRNGGWAPRKGGHDPPFKEKRGSCQKNNTKMYRPSFPPVSVW